MRVSFGARLGYHVAVIGAIVASTILFVPAPPVAAAAPPKLQQGPTTISFRSCSEQGCDPVGHAEREIDIQFDAPSGSGARVKHVKQIDLTTGDSVVSTSTATDSDTKSAANKPIKIGAAPEQALGGVKIRLADAYGPGCCSASGGGVLNVTNTACDYTHYACFNLHTYVWWNWGDGRVWNQRPGLDYWAQPDTYQYLDYSSCCYQDGGPVWGMPQGYYDYQGRGYGSGFLSYKAQVVHACISNWCYGDYQPWTDMYVHNDGSWYTSWGY